MALPEHVVFHLEVMNEIPGEVWMQAGIAAIVIAAVTYVLYSMLLKRLVLSRLLGGPQRIVVRDVDRQKPEALLELSGLSAGRTASLEFVLQVSSAATHTQYSPKRTVTTTVGEESHDYRVSPPSAVTDGKFRIRVPLPRESFTPATGEFTRVTRVHLWTYHPWFPAIELGVNEYGVLGLQNDVIGLTPDSGVEETPFGQLEEIGTGRARHSKGRVPTALLGLVYLFLSSLPVIGPYLLLEGLFQRDLYRVEMTLLEAEVAVLDSNLDRADNLLKTLNPGSIRWYGGYKNAMFETRKDQVQTWVKVRKGTATAEDVARLYSGMPADIIKAEHLVRAGSASEAVHLYTTYLSYEGEYWRVFPSLMTSVRFLLQHPEQGDARSLAHHCLLRIPEWKRQSPTTEEFRLFLAFCRENPLPAESP